MPPPKANRVNVIIFVFEYSQDQNVDVSVFMQVICEMGKESNVVLVYVTRIE